MDVKTRIKEILKRCQLSTIFTTKGVKGEHSGETRRGRWEPGREKREITVTG